MARGRGVPRTGSLPWPWGRSTDGVQGSKHPALSPLQPVRPVPGRITLHLTRYPDGHPTRYPVPMALVLTVAVVSLSCRQRTRFTPTTTSAVVTIMVTVAPDSLRTPPSPGAPPGLTEGWGPSPYPRPRPPSPGITTIPPPGNDQTSRRHTPNRHRGGGHPPLPVGPTEGIGPLRLPEGLAAAAHGKHRPPTS